MSRIGKLPINVPSNVEVTISDSEIKVKGPKGELTQALHANVNVTMEENTITVTPIDETKFSRSLHGLYRSLVNNMVVGVTEGYKKQLEIIGVGYRVAQKGTNLEFQLGFSHPVNFEVPSDVKVTLEQGKTNIITLESHDKQLIGQVASDIRSLKKPEPYKGKGIRYVGEYVRRKAGKTSAK
jgi:large subunit ribosomal protein L6